ncbi:hypothetical protein ABI59_19870 [Acidobacteria bacterium Mor1]|nr:hypothetical protein ABI59_19870 [Acidobacteria bacterium Mor1]
MIGREDILECRKMLGAPGERSFSLLDRLLYLPVRRPSWVDRDEGLWPMFKNSGRVLRHGHVVLAHLIQANALLFEPGDENCPAAVVFCPDPETHVPLDVLGRAASEIYSLKDTTPAKRELREIADSVTDELARSFDMRVPESLSGGYPLVESTTFITRRHIPNRVLSGSFFPLLISPSAPHYNFPVPSRFWPESFLSCWTRTR